MLALKFRTGTTTLTFFVTWANILLRNKSLAERLAFVFLFLRLIAEILAELAICKLVAEARALNREEYSWKRCSKILRKLVFPCFLQLWELLFPLYFQNSGVPVSKGNGLPISFIVSLDFFSNENYFFENFRESKISRKYLARLRALVEAESFINQIFVFGKNFDLFFWHHSFLLWEKLSEPELSEFSARIHFLPAMLVKNVFLHQTGFIFSIAEALVRRESCFLKPYLKRKVVRQQHHACPENCPNEDIKPCLLLCCVSTKKLVLIWQKEAFFNLLFRNIKNALRFIVIMGEIAKDIGHRNKLNLTISCIPDKLPFAVAMVASD